jgi:acetyl-CoA synthetase
MSESPISVNLREERSFPPSWGFTRRATLQPLEYAATLRYAAGDSTHYWAEAALDLQWFRAWDRVLEWKAPFAKWFVGGRINASTNCLDRHLGTEVARKAALVWEGEPGETATWTYAELHDQVERLTTALRKLGLKPGDRVAIYLPMIPEAAAAMLACARGGFTHTVVFGGFSAEALKDRINDAEARAVITADFGWRKGAKVALREQVDAAIAHCPSIEFVVQCERARAGQLVPAALGTPAARPPAKAAKAAAYAWHELIAGVAHDERKKLGRAEELDSEHPLFILYTSGTTGKPKGIVHSTGGYLTGCLRTFKQVFDPQPADLYWCTADVGWVTGHSYVVYGPLAAGASVLMYEGAPTTPGPDRFWSIIERHRVTVLYTAPTAIRAFMRLGTDPVKKHDLSSLRLLGSVGEPINPGAWMWYREHIGGSRCPIVDTYWQTETGSIVVSPVPGVTATKPGSATFALPGFDVAVVDKKGQPVPAGSGGYLVIRKPWPSMMRTIYKDPERFRKQYFSEFGEGIYFTGDGARRDEDGYLWCLGRVDDVLNVSGHRLGTMEVESALVSHPKVAEAAVVGRPDELKGQGVVAFVTVKASEKADLKKLEAELKAHVAKEIGAIARPDEIRFTDGLPKTRSGKIMRRLLRELATSGQVKGDVTTLEDLNVLAALQKEDEE